MTLIAAHLRAVDDDVARKLGRPRSSNSVDQIDDLLLRVLMEVGARS
jgi:hypothetical protein